VTIIGGLRLFEYSGADPVQLERIKVMELPGGRTHLRFRVNKETEELLDYGAKQRFGFGAQIFFCIFVQRSAGFGRCHER
jgi:hypothetical protein